MGNIITCCSSEEIIPQHNPPNAPSVFTDPDENNYKFPRCDSDLMK